MTLNRMLRSSLLWAVKQTGSYNPSDTLFLIEEQLTGTEALATEEFLQWCYDNKRTFGHGNIGKLWKEWRSK